MTYFTGLARVARDAGLKVVEVDGWQKRGYGGMNEVKTIVCHHTAGPLRDNYPSLAVMKNGRPGVPGPLAQLGLGRDGTVYVIAAGRANHAGKVSRTDYSNPHALGIEAENNGTGEEWPVAQLDAYVRLCAALIKEFGLDVSDVLGHKEVCAPKGRKIDPAFIKPNITMNEFRSYVKAGRYPGADAKPAPEKPKPTTPTKPAGGKWPAVALPITDAHTDASHQAWVDLLASVGYRDASLSSAFQRWLEWLGYYKGRLDSVMGPLTVKALQSFLKSKKLYDGLIDGDRGPRTIRAELAYLNDQRKHQTTK